MATFSAIAAIGQSIVRMLDAAFRAEEPVSGHTTTAALVRTEDFQRIGTNVSGVIQPPALSLFLYRVDFNKSMRAAWSAVGSLDGRGHLPLDLHLLLTPWADNAEHEQRILGKTLETIEATPVLSGPMLHPAAGWEESESIQLLMEEMTTEAVMRTFDSLPIDYQLSVPYLARVVRLTTNAHPEPMVTTAVTGIRRLA